MRFPIEYQTVVCVDDQPEILSALRRTLAGEPYTLHVTPDPLDVFEWVEKADVGVVVTDQRMPFMSGTELLEAVARRSPSTARIVLTAYAPSTGRIRRIGHRTDCLLSKPWDGVMLRRTIRELLHERWLGKLDEELSLHPARIGDGP